MTWLQLVLVFVAGFALACAVQAGGWIVARRRRSRIVSDELPLLRRIGRADG